MKSSSLLRRIISIRGWLLSGIMILSLLTLVGCSLSNYMDNSKSESLKQTEIALAVQQTQFALQQAQPGAQDTQAPPPEAPPVAGEPPRTAESTAAPAANSDTSLCKLPIRPTSDVFNYKRMGIPRHPGFAPSTGDVNIQVLFADFSDARSSQSPEQDFALVYPSVALDILNTGSYGRGKFTFQPRFTWLNLSQPVAYYRNLLARPDGKTRAEPEKIRAFLQEVASLADASVDFSSADILIVITNTQAPDGLQLEQFSTAEDAQGIQADGTAIRSGIVQGSSILSSDVFYKNGGLAQRLIELATLEPLYYAADLFPSLTTPEEQSAPVGVFSLLTRGLLTGPADGFFAFERWQLGWLDDGQIFCQPGGDQTTELSAIQQAGNMKAVMVPLSPTSALVVESRRPVGFDYIQPGALVYTVDTSIEAGKGPIQVLPVSDNDDWRHGKSPLAQGESLEYCNITITNVVAGANGDTVRVIIPDVIECPQETAKPDIAALCAAVPASTQSNVMVRFINNTSAGAVTGYWVDNTGQLVEYFTLQPGEYVDQPTNAGDRWIIKDQSGVTLLDYTATAQPTQCAPAPGATTAPAAPTPTASQPLPTITMDKNGCPIIQGATVICYDVTGVTQDELVKSMANNSPVTPDTYRTKWWIAWNWPNYGKANCNVSQATVDLTNLIVYIPRWKPPAGASPNLVAKWEAWIMNISIREQLRVNFVRDNYPMIKTAIQNATCTTADAEAQKALDQLGVSADGYVNGFLKEIFFP